ncbi:glycosyltransferase family 2 protein [Candidatus Bathyarchaeota archaeon]|nr:MAG: glycosyltransferase family 2 protein [Candidatus Bathyarchaeota archaeon]
MYVSVVIPALNEERTVAEVVKGVLRFADEVIVVDDGSTDRTAELAKLAGARVVRHPRRLGAWRAVKTGFRLARGDVIVTMGADGQHNPADIPRLLEPIRAGKADLVLGVRQEIPYFSERFIRALVSLVLPCSDASTGMVAIKRSLLARMPLRGDCPCGTLVLEAYGLGARIAEVPIVVRPRRYGRRRVKTRHVRQTFFVLLDMGITIARRRAYRLKTRISRKTCL